MRGIYQISNEDEYSDESYLVFHLDLASTFILLYVKLKIGNDRIKSLPGLRGVYSGISSVLYRHVMIILRY